MQQQDCVVTLLCEGLLSEDEGVCGREFLDQYAHAREGEFSYDSTRIREVEKISKSYNFKPSRKNRLY
ncbi:MAG: hypothetical protein NTZ94_12370 [Verrucomicrobia bacterium]|nr:hypothetical protein [Verrucomicrobiota bacterium]